MTFEFEIVAAPTFAAGLSELRRRQGTRAAAFASVLFALACLASRRADQWALTAGFSPTWNARLVPVRAAEFVRLTLAAHHSGLFERSGNSASCGPRSKMVVSAPLRIGVRGASRCSRSRSIHSSWRFTESSTGSKGAISERSCPGKAPCPTRRAIPCPLATRKPWGAKAVRWSRPLYLRHLPRSSAPHRRTRPKEDRSIQGRLATSCSSCNAQNNSAGSLSAAPRAHGIENGP